MCPWKSPCKENVDEAKTFKTTIFRVFLYNSVPIVMNLLSYDPEKCWNFLKI